MGHSMGAGVAALAAGTYPERVRRLVMIEGTGPRSARPEDLPLSLARHMHDEVKAARLPLRTRPAALATAVRARMVSSPLTPRSAELLARRGTRQIGNGVLWRNDRRLSVLQPSQLDEAQIDAFLARIACPTLLVRADAGIGHEPALVDRRLALIAGARAVQVPGRHHVHMDDPHVIAAHVATFLER
jgi:pimeloyl-ACP methyl ester carboxylesterase